MHQYGVGFSNLLCLGCTACTVPFNPHVSVMLKWSQRWLHNTAAGGTHSPAGTTHVLVLLITTSPLAAGAADVGETSAHIVWGGWGCGRGRPQHPCPVFFSLMGQQGVGLTTAALGMPHMVWGTWCTATMCPAPAPLAAFCTLL